MIASARWPLPITRQVMEYEASEGRAATAKMTRPSIRWRLKHRLLQFCLKHAGTTTLGRIAAWVACHHLPPYHQTAHLADLRPEGFIAPGAHVTHPDLRLGNNVYLGSRVVVYSTQNGGPVTLGDKVQIYGNTFIETGRNGSIRIGENTHVQPGCHIHAYIGGIRIGKKVEIAPGCALYCYDHGVEAGIPIMDQPLVSKGDIVIGDGAWLGRNVTVLQNVTIGEGAVVAAGAVVTRDIPPNAIAAGIPAKVIKYRDSAPS